MLSYDICSGSGPYFCEVWARWFNPSRLKYVMKYLCCLQQNSFKIKSVMMEKTNFNYVAADDLLIYFLM